MYVSPEGRWFAHAAPAVVHAFELDPDLARYYADYAPSTVAFLKHAEAAGTLHRKMRWDEFFERILVRAGFAVRQ